MTKGTRATWRLLSVMAFWVTAASASAATLRYSGTASPLTMDPHSTNSISTVAFLRQVYDPLVGLADDMSIVPGLATEWSYQGSDTWRFKLRPGVTFHDGSPMTADDVVFSVMREKASPLYASSFGDIKSAAKVDDSTVDVISNRPDPILPVKMVRLFVMSKAWTMTNGSEKIADLGAPGTEAYTLRHANGTGPMKLVSQDSQKTVFARNHAYWGAFPGNLDDAVFTAISSAPTRVAALLSGQLDLSTDLPNQDLDRVKNASGFKVEQAPQQFFMELEMDGTRDVGLDMWDKSGQPLKANPFRDVRVRQAFADTIDANLIVQRVMLGQAKVIGTAAAPGFSGYQKDLDVHWPIDINKAKELLAAAGYPAGFAVQLNCPLDIYVNADEICRAVASMLARIGVEVRVKGIVWPEFARLLVNGPNSSFHLIGSASNSGSTQDTFVSLMETRNRALGHGGTNWALWSNQEFDKVADELAVTFDEAKRTELYRKGLSIGHDQVHAVYLHQPTISWGMRQGVSVPARADGAVMLQNVQVP